jgi:hypothetical protein
LYYVVYWAERGGGLLCCHFLSNRFGIGYGKQMAAMLVLSAVGVVAPSVKKYATTQSKIYGRFAASFEGYSYQASNHFGSYVYHRK